MQRKRISVYLSLYSDLGILQPPMKYEERFFTPSNRVSDCRASGATRNEDWPDSPTVKRNEGMEKKECNIIVQIVASLAAKPILKRSELWEKTTCFVNHAGSNSERMLPILPKA